MLDRIENDLQELVAQFGNGWVVFTRRPASAGLREYFFYFGGDAELGKVAPALKEKYPDTHRIRSKTRPQMGTPPFTGQDCAG